MHLRLFGGREAGKVFLQQFFQLLRSLAALVLICHSHTLTIGGSGSAGIQPAYSSLSKMDGGVNCRKARGFKFESNPFRVNLLAPYNPEYYGEQA